MPVSLGTRLGPYEILSLIGSGGMGQVYKARDTRLDRIVAIKISEEKFSARFEREARTVAALSHPNICHLYDVGPNYLVMEYVEGKPIAPVDSLRKLLDLGVQIADGMAAAHAASIVHRDLKPDNILVTGDGRVKILDFGLAKLNSDASTGDATATIAITDPGTTVGTVAYMSPEQARGGVDLTSQSDQFSFGLVLYEMIAGKRAFRRGSAAETMTAIIREEPDPLPASTPAPLRWIMERLLSKDPADRYDSTRDLFRELRQIRERLSETLPAATSAIVAQKSKRLRAIPTLSIAAVGILLGAGAMRLMKPVHEIDLSSYRFTPLARDGSRETSPQWSPDGQSITYIKSVRGVSQVFIKAVGARDTTQLTTGSGNCSSPFWSPDGSSVFYISNAAIWSVGATGGPPELLVDRVEAAAPHPDGKNFAFLRDSKLWTGTLKSSAWKEVTQAPLPANLTTSWIRFSPDGSKLAVLESSGVLWVIPYPSGPPRRVRSGLISLGGGWFSDSRRIAVSGRPNGFSALAVVDTADGSLRTLYSSTDPVLTPSVSGDGKRIAFASGKTEWDVLEIAVPSGGIRALVSGGGIAMLPDWAPSGTHFVFASNHGGPYGLEDQSAAEAFSRKLLQAPPGQQFNQAHWSPDGSRLVFVKGPTGPYPGQLMLANAAGGGVVAVKGEQDRVYGPSWSPDGQWVLYIREHNGARQLAKIMPGSGGPVVLENAQPINDPLELGSPYSSWSPTGEWLVLANPQGLALISPDGRSIRQLSRRRISPFGFTRDGRQVLGIYRNPSLSGPEWQLISLDVATGSEKFLAPLNLPGSVDGLSGFSLHPDGKRLLVSAAKWPYEIWMLEGFDQAPPRNWLDRIFSR